MALLDSEQKIDLQVTPTEPVKVEIKVGQRVLMLGVLTLITVIVAKAVK